MREPFTKEMANLPKAWEDWCNKGKYSVGVKRRPAKDQLDKNNKVRGFYSDLILNPTLAHTDSLYPSIEHVIPKRNDGKLVVEARIINDMKSHLGDAWRSNFIEGGKQGTVDRHPGPIPQRAIRCGPKKRRPEGRRQAAGFENPAGAVRRRGRVAARRSKC
jgi:hypothetical protein